MGVGARGVGVGGGAGEATAEVEAQAREFEALENAQFVPISAKYGTNIAALSDRIGHVIREHSTSKTEDASIVKDKRVSDLFVCGTGTVLNIWNSRQTGTVLHLIMQHGVVAVGEHFSAGGWCGVVRKIVHDNQAVVTSAWAGMGVHLTVVLSKLIEEPRPLGDRIYFHGPQPGSSDRKAAKQSKSDANKCQAAAESVVLQHQLQARIGFYAISDATAKHYRLEDAYERVKNSVEYHRKRALAEEGSDADDESIATAAETVEEEEEEEEEVEDDPLECRVLVKADTGMGNLSLGTILDARDEAAARFEENPTENRPPNRVVFSGVGDVTLRDVTIAQAANALIVTYGVGIELEAARASAQSGGVRMLGLDSMQSAVDAVVFADGSSATKGGADNAQFSIGGLGPLDGQFRDPVSVSAHLPDRFRHHKDSESGSVPVPSWYRGECSRDDLEDELYDEQLQGNFLVARRPRVHRDAAETYDILHLTHAKALRHVIVQRDLSLATRPLFVANQGGAGAEICHHASLWDLVRAQRHYHLGDDPRPFALIAVADRRNFRVQVFRYYWTRSELYVPGIEIALVIGGIHNRFVKLVDPVSVAYSPSCELAICDSGTKCVVIMSQSMDVVRRIDLLYISPHDLRVAQKANEAASNEAQTKSTRLSSDAKDHKSSSVTADSAPNSNSGMNKPCSVAFSPVGNLAVGYKNGGVYVYEAYKAYEVGHLKKLQSHILERVILSYLEYRDLTALRDCCNCLHNFTQELRLSWKIFPRRASHINQVVVLFVRWSRIGAEGVRGLNETTFPLLDCDGRAMCLRHMNRECPASEALQNLLIADGGRSSPSSPAAAASLCVASHGALRYDVEELCALDAYVELEDLLFFASVLFGPKFLWRYDVYIRELFVAFGVDRDVCSRRDPMSRRNETVREAIPQTTRVLLFRRYLELMTILQEQHSELKEIHAHKLFRRSPRSRFQPKEPMTVDTVDPRLVPDPTEQYARGIDVPHKSIKGPHYITKKGLEHAERQASSDIREHVETFRSHTEHAASRINGLFM
eukprot:gene28198-35014_t